MKMHDELQDFIDAVEDKRNTVSCELVPENDEVYVNIYYGYDRPHKYCVEYYLFDVKSFRLLPRRTQNLLASVLRIIHEYKYEGEMTNVFKGL